MNLPWNPKTGQYGWLFLSLIFFLLLACSKKTSYKNQDFPKEFTLKGKPLYFVNKDKFLLEPWRGIKFDSLLLLKNTAKADSKFTIVDIKNQEILKHFGKEGRGPLEVIFSFTGCVMKSQTKKRSFEFYNINLGKYFRLNIDSILTNKRDTYEVLADFSNHKKVEGNEVTKPFKVKNINDNLFLATGYYEYGRYKLIDSQGKSYGAFLKYPDDQIENVDNRLKCTAYQPFIRWHPNKNSFVCAIIASDFIEICNFDPDNYQINQEWNFYSYLPQYKIANEFSVKFDGNGKVGNTSLFASPEYIYVQRLNKTYKEQTKGMEVNIDNEQIIVYDWQGNLKYKLKLDKKVIGVVTDEKEKIMYAFANNPEPQIIKYKLPF